MKKSPWEQARASLHELRAELLRRLISLYPGRFVELPFIFGNVVAIPLSECASTELLPLDAPRETLWDATTLRRLGPAVEETFRFWRGGRTVIPLSESEFKNFRRNALQPVLQLVPTLGAKLAAEGEQIRRLSEQQARVFAGIAGNRRARVIGGAGTGRTLLARELVRELAGQGERVLLACFNRNLAAHLRDGFAADEFAGDAPTVRHFHRPCRDAFLALDRDIAFPNRDDVETSRRFWDEDAPLVLLEALMTGAMPRFDAIVVDEAQDFLPDWWATIEDLLADKLGSKIYAFLDSRQAFFGRASVVREYDAVFRLTHNYRKRRIADTLAALTGDAVARLPWLWNRDSKVVSDELAHVLAYSSPAGDQAAASRDALAQWTQVLLDGHALRRPEVVLRGRDLLHFLGIVPRGHLKCGEVLWQGPAGFCVVLNAVERVNKNTVMLLKLQGSHQPSKFQATLTWPVRALLSSEAFLGADHLEPEVTQALGGFLKKIITAWQSNSDRG